MTLDEIIAGMEHNAGCLTRSFSTAPTGNASECWCGKFQLIAFRAEMEEMAQKWDEEANKRYFTDARFAFQNTAAELRAKIGERK